MEKNLDEVVMDHYSIGNVAFFVVKQSGKWAELDGMYSIVISLRKQAVLTV